VQAHLSATAGPSLPSPPSSIKKREIGRKKEKEHGKGLQQRRRTEKGVERKRKDCSSFLFALPYSSGDAILIKGRRQSPGWLPFPSSRKRRGAGGDGSWGRHSDGRAPGGAGSARCVRRLDGSLVPAIRITYRVSLRSSSSREPRYPSTGVVSGFLFHSCSCGGLSRLEKKGLLLSFKLRASSVAPFIFFVFLFSQKEKEIKKKEWGSTVRGYNGRAPLLPEKKGGLPRFASGSRRAKRTNEFPLCFF
jgi:hypothetical protein